MQSALKCLLVVLATTATANAGVVLNEIFVNPSGTDNGNEFFEIRNLDGGAVSLDGLSFVVIEGDTAIPGQPGMIDLAMSLAGLSTGPNGLLLWRDADTVLNPAPAPETTVHVEDINPDFENGGQTYLLARNFSGTVGTDLDTNDDGVLDATPWDAVLDAVAHPISSESGFSILYAALLGGIEFPAVAMTPDGLFRPRNNPATWVGSDGDGTSPGPWAFETGKMLFPDGTDATSYFVAPDNVFTPGGENAAMIPEPSAIAMLAVLGLLTGGISTLRSRQCRESSPHELSARQSPELGALPCD